MTGHAAPIETANFGFLAKHDVQLMRLGALAERYFGDDPNTSLIKLRQFAELLAKLTAARLVCFPGWKNHKLTCYVGADKMINPVHPISCS
jgi:hypothetical protein